MKIEPAGLPPSGKPAFLAVGRIRRPHGLRGEVLVELLTDFPERIKPNASLFLGNSHRELVVVSVRNHKDGLLLGFNEYQDSESARKLGNHLIYVRVDALQKLPEDQYYHHDLIGIQVFTDEDRVLGVISEIIQTGANDVFIVQDYRGEEILLPAIADVIQDIDLLNKTMKVRLLPGLLNG